MRIQLFILLLTISTASQAQVFQWLDEKGQVHYGDRPPATLPVRLVDMTTTSVTTVGETGLRPAEITMLERIETQAQALALAKATAKAKAKAEVAARAKEQTVVIIEDDEKPDRVVALPHYFYPSYYKDRKRHRRHKQSGLSIHYSSGHHKKPHRPYPPVLPPEPTTPSDSPDTPTIVPVPTAAAIPASAYAPGIRRIRPRTWPR